MTKSLRRFQAGTARMGNLAGNVAASGLIEQFKQIAGGAVEMAAKFERYEAVLTNTLGTQKAASGAMKTIQLFAAKTPFSVDELTASYISLANRGIKPSMAVMTRFGDIASSQGKSFNQFTEAVLDAVSGEFERLKEFGIKGSKAGGQATLAFKGVTKVVKNTPEAIQQALESFGELQGVKGGMLAISRTWEGMVSNIGDSADALKVSLGREIINALRPMGMAFGDSLGSAASFFGHTEHGAARTRAALLVLAPLIGTVLTAATLTAAMSVFNTLLPAFQLMGSLALAAKSSIMFLISAIFGERAALIQNIAARKASMLSRKISLALGAAEKANLTIGAVLQGVLTGKITAATAAQWLWNTALAANPLGLTVLAIVAVIAAIAGLIIYFDEISAFVMDFPNLMRRAWDWILQLPARVVAYWGTLPGWVQSLTSVLAPLFAIPMWIYKHWNTASRIPAMFMGTWSTLLSYAQSLYQVLRRFLIGIAESIAAKWQWIVGIPGRVLGAWSRLPGWAQALVGIFAPFVALPLTIAKHWNKAVSVVQGALGLVKSAGSLLGFGGGEAAPAGRGRRLPTGAAAAPQVFDSRSTKVEKSEVKVTFDQLPAGTRVKQDRPAKGTDIEYTGLALGGAL